MMIFLCTFPHSNFVIVWRLQLCVLFCVCSYSSRFFSLPLLLSLIILSHLFAFFFLLLATSVSILARFFSFSSMKYVHTIYRETSHSHMCMTAHAPFDNIESYVITALCCLFLSCVRKQRMKREITILLLLAHTCTFACCNATVIRRNRTVFGFHPILRQTHRLPNAEESTESTSYVRATETEQTSTITRRKRFFLLLISCYRMRAIF